MTGAFDVVMDRAELGLTPRPGSRRPRSARNGVDRPQRDRYPTEWWHWSFGDRYRAFFTGEPAARYGVATGQVRRVPRAARASSQGRTSSSVSRTASA